MCLYFLNAIVLPLLCVCLYVCSHDLYMCLHTLWTCLHEHVHRRPLFCVEFWLICVTRISFVAICLNIACYSVLTPKVHKSFSPLYITLQGIQFNSWDFCFNLIILLDLQLLFKLNRPFEVASRGHSFIIGFSKALTLHEVYDGCFIK
jgi:hypothetical protein